MLQFIQGSDAAFADLERQAQNACIVFPNQQMPPNTRPAMARIGFEISASGEALLLVDRGLRYQGSSAEVREWMRSGTKRFANFARLKEWVQRDLASAYGIEPSGTPTRPDAFPPTNEDVPAPRPIPRLDQLSDIDAISQSVQYLNRPTSLSADALYHQLRRHVLGQDEALQLLARRIVRHLARRVPSHPATIFAVGPTGVGKTRTAAYLAPALRAVNPVEANYSSLRLDMSEYQERYRVSQLLGSPQGYIGYDEGSQLLDALITNPKTIVIFDEIEKAHRDVFQSLMNAMDAGRFSSPRPRNSSNTQGREVDCRAAIFFFTSNLDASPILRDIEERGAANQPRKIEEICRTHLRTQGIAPELIGRINTFLVFRPLSMQTRAEILLLSIIQVAREYGVEVAYVEPEVVTTLLQEAQSEDFGARPDVNLVDDLLGPVFEEAAQRFPELAVRINDDPLRCEPYYDTRH